MRKEIKCPKCGGRFMSICSGLVWCAWPCNEYFDIAKLVKKLNSKDEGKVE